VKATECGLGACALHILLGMALVVGGLFALAASGPLSDRRKYGRRR
jgi:hypothetical protein